MLDAVSIRNKEKRLYFLELISKHNLNCISLLDNFARISSTAKIGRGVFIDAFVVLEQCVEISDFCNIYAFTLIGHHTKVCRNSVFQRHCMVTGNCTVREDCYVGSASFLLKNGAVFGKNTFIHETVYISRGTVENEIVGQNGKNMKRVKIYGH